MKTKPTKEHEPSPLFNLVHACQQFGEKGSWLSRGHQTVEDYELIIRLNAAQLVEAEGLKSADLLPAYNAMIARNRKAQGLPPL